MNARFTGGTNLSCLDLTPMHGPTQSLIPLLLLTAMLGLMIGCGGGGSSGAGGGVSGGSGPVAKDDSVSLPFNTPWFIHALANDLGDDIKIERWTNPSRGSLRLEGLEGFTYTPQLGTFGTDTFTYTISDRVGAESTATVSLMIQRPNLPPVIQPDFYVLEEDTVLTVAPPGILANDTEPEGESLTLTLPVTTKYGSLVLLGDGSFTYTPNPDFFGTDEFTYRLRDASGATADGRVELTVLPMPDAPRATNDNLVVAPNSTLFAAAPGILINDVEPDGEPMTAMLVTLTSHGTVALGSGGALQYTPNTDFAGRDSFTYRVTDPTGRSDVGIVEIDVGIFNAAPNAVPDTYTMAEDTVLVVPTGLGLLANDSDADLDPLTATLYSPPDFGVAVVALDGSFTYTPNLNFFGLDGFLYVASDGRGGITSAWVEINVTPVNDPPIVTDDFFSTPEGQLLFVPAPGVLANDHDPEGGTISVVRVVSTSFGSANIGANGSFQYQPPAAFSGVAQVVFEVQDEQGLIATSTATVNVTTTVPPPGGISAGALMDTGFQRHDFRIEVSRSGQPSVLQGSTVTVSIGVDITGSNLPSLNLLQSVSCEDILTGMAVPLSPPTVVSSTIMGFTFEVNTAGVGFKLLRYRIRASNINDESVERELSVPVHTGSVLGVGSGHPHTTIASALSAALAGDAIHIFAASLSGTGNTALGIDKNVVVAANGVVIDGANTNSGWLMTGAEPILTGLTFTNFTDSALHAFDTSGTVFNCSFVSNSSSIGGGAVAVQGSLVPGFVPRIINCLFQVNVAPKGGAINVDLARRLEVIQSSFIGNLATSPIMARGGGIAVSNGEGLTLRNNLFLSNDVLLTGANGNGGFIPNGAGGAVSVTSCSFGNQPSLLVRSTEFRSNKVGTVAVTIEINGHNPDLAGGAVAVEDCPAFSARFEDCLFAVNNVRSYPTNFLPSFTGQGYAVGGAVFIGRPAARLVVISTRMHGNFTFSPSMSVGGAVSTQALPLGLVQHSEFIQNEARGPGVRNVGGAWGSSLSAGFPLLNNPATPFGSLTFDNCLAAENRATLGAAFSFANTEPTGDAIQPFTFLNVPATPATQVPVVHFSNATVANNSHLTPAGTVSVVVSALPLEVLNSILWNPLHTDVHLVNAGAPVGTASSGSLLVTTSIMRMLTGAAGGTPQGGIDTDPLFTVGAAGDYYLSRIPFQGTNSPALNAGTGTAIQAGLESRTTSSNGADDTGIVDLGFHYLY